jgi:hypothetical protein|tara:strand:- start:169 stop:441 length:273 start_codon:yes stop_codon:yes gene_type:complete
MNNKGDNMFERVTKYYEWKKHEKGKKFKHIPIIPIQHDSPEHRYMTPEWERIFPGDSDLLTEIDLERYMRLVRRWGQKLYEELEEIKEGA